MLGHYCFGVSYRDAIQSLPKPQPEPDMHAPVPMGCLKAFSEALDVEIEELRAEITSLRAEVATLKSAPLVVVARRSWWRRLVE